MLKHKRLSMAVALALAGASTANAGIGFKAGEWDIDFSGNVNGFATYNDCATKNVAPVAGGLACNQPPGHQAEHDQYRIGPAAERAGVLGQVAPDEHGRGRDHRSVPDTSHRRSRQRQFYRQQLRWVMPASTSGRTS